MQYHNIKTGINIIEEQIMFDNKIESVIRKSLTQLKRKVRLEIVWQRKTQQKQQVVNLLVNTPIIKSTSCQQT